jgi:hypothetical protein
VAAETLQQDPTKQNKQGNARSEPAASMKPIASNKTKGKKVSDH